VLEDRLSLLPCQVLVVEGLELPVAPIASRQLITTNSKSPPERTDRRSDRPRCARFAHRRSNVALVPRVLRVVPLEVRAEFVVAALAWLDGHRRGDVFVPEELLPLVAVA
jgi:uncharacterized protein YjeT (DUF2065 family)